MKTKKTSKFSLSKNTLSPTFNPVGIRIYEFFVCFYRQKMSIINQLTMLIVATDTHTTVIDNINIYMNLRWVTRIDHNLRLVEIDLRMHAFANDEHAVMYTVFVRSNRIPNSIYPFASIDRWHRYPNRTSLIRRDRSYISRKTIVQNELVLALDTEMSHRYLSTMMKLFISDNDTSHSHRIQWN